MRRYFSKYSYGRTILIINVQVQLRYLLHLLSWERMFSFSSPSFDSTHFCCFLHSGVVLYTILKKDLLLKASMGLKRRLTMKKKSKIVIMIADKMSTLLVFVLFYGLQMSITVMQQVFQISKVISMYHHLFIFIYFSQVITKVFEIHISCGNADLIAMTVGRVFAIIVSFFGTFFSKFSAFFSDFHIFIFISLYLFLIIAGNPPTKDQHVSYIVVHLLEWR